MILHRDTINVSEIFTSHKTDAESFTWPKVPHLLFYPCRCICKEGAEQRLQRLKITFFGSFSSFFSSKPHAPFSYEPIRFPTKSRMLIEHNAGTCSVLSLTLQGVQQCWWCAAQSGPHVWPPKSKALNNAIAPYWLRLSTVRCISLKRWTRVQYSGNARCNH